MNSIIKKFSFLIIFALSANGLAPMTRRYVEFRRCVLSATKIEDLSIDLFDKLKSKLDLKRTDYTDVLELGSQFKLAKLNGIEVTGTAHWYDESKGNKLTGVSVFSLVAHDYEEHNIDIWLGPGLLVPHMFLKVSSKGGAENGFSVSTDFYPRGPNAFGTDQNYLDLYYKDIISEYRSRAGYLPSPQPLSFFARLMQSPACFSATSITGDVAVDLATRHVDKWLQLLSEAKPVDARQRAGINTRDDKLRQFAYRARLDELSLEFDGVSAKSLAAAFTGPLAEAYIGGGS